MSVRKLVALENGDSEATPASSQKRRRMSYGDSSYLTEMRMTQEENALSGILERVIVKNFMCHDHLEFTFSPNINFVQGRNGSGKSAILTAVVVGLGGNVRATNRGSSMKELVKYGKHTATIDIYIKNGGRDAFKHEVYGDCIIVERKIMSSGGGSYKIKAKDGTLVSTKKDEIIRILDHFNLQVENPVTVLNQDMSRSFLNSTDPQDLYRFFLEATQLQQMRDNYTQLQEALRSCSATIDGRKEDLPVLKKEVEEHRARYEFSKSLADKWNKLRELRRELIWTIVHEAEKEEKAVVQKVEAYEVFCSKLQEKITTYQTNFEEEQQQHKALQEDLANRTHQLSNQAREAKAANELMGKAKAKLKDQQMHAATAEKKVKSIQKEISELKEAIEKDHSAAQNDWAAQRAAWLKKREDLEMEVQEIQQGMKTEETHHGNIINTMERKKAEQKEFFLEEKAIRAKCSGLEKELTQLRSQQSNVFTVYGQWVPEVLKQIDIEHKKGMFSAKPIGPLGAFIKLRDQKWGHVAEAIIANRINSFCVNNQKDCHVLKQILNRVNFGGSQKPIITVSRFRERVHDVSQFEVQSDRYPSLWSILDVSDTVVANTLIDQMQVESTLLIPTAQEAGRLLKDQRTVPKNCKVAYTLNRDIYYPDPNYKIYSGRGEQPARYLQVSVEQKIRDLQAEIESTREKLKNHLIMAKEYKVEAEKLENEIRLSNRKLQKEKARILELRGQMTVLQNQEEPAPPDVSQLEEDIRQQETLLESAQTRAEEYRSLVVEYKEKYQEASSKYEILRQEQNELLQEAEDIKKKVNQCEQRTNKLLQTLEGYKKKKKDTETKKKELEAELKVAKEACEKEKERATNFQPRFETTRSAKDVSSQYKALEARLNKEEAERGDPVDIAHKYKEVQQRYSNIVKIIEGHSNLLEVIQQSLDKRHQEFGCFRRFTSIMIKSHFRNMLISRNLHGTLHFDFEKGILTMKVVKLGSENDATTIAQSKKNNTNRKKGAHQTQAMSGSENDAQSKQNNTNRNAQQTLAMMSGGERSFCTVSFILALWEVMESPIRILDEFDVFMDIVARKQSMDMMIDAANAKTQYIYLTPLELNKAEHPNVNIYRMPDPERREDD
ncbi:structural maintenance of chromosomes protein 6-like [Penaeus japonicus]|uniref:structural maintenance of chromosomes protein 6-like n=1 Tax=Penaeus japonicus TaxID=27405 RepID=UPI001C70C723|nr:structural maintenance of chromosomes protein 6-like [Penaeus japonicus]